MASAFFPHLSTPTGRSELQARLQVPARASGLPDDPRLGMSSRWLAELLADWARFDVAAYEARLAAYEHRQVDVAGQTIHVCVAAGQGRAPRPLVLTNGWPSSFLEYLDLLPLLTQAADPGEHTYDCFSVVIPALPGFGYSAPPPEPRTGRQVAELWNTLMTDELGHTRYVAHGTDLGSGITAWLARDHPDRVDAIHLGSPHFPPAPAPANPEEQSFSETVAAWMPPEGAYSHLHASKPATLAAALLDSPAGLAAWVSEKFRDWSSSDLSSGPPRDLLLATLSLYWSTATIGTSMLPYWAHANADGAAGLPIDDPGPVPAAIDIFRGGAGALSAGPPVPCRAVRRGEPLARTHRRRPLPGCGGPRPACPGAA